MPRGTGIMCIIFFFFSLHRLHTRAISVTWTHCSDRAGRTFMYMLYYTGTYYTHTHETAAHGRTCTHIRNSTRPTHEKEKKDRVQRIRSKRLCAMRKKEERRRKKKRKKKRNSFLDRCVPTGRKIRRHFTEV